MLGDFSQYTLFLGETPSSVSACCSLQSYSLEIRDKFFVE